MISLFRLILLFSLSFTPKAFADEPAELKSLSWTPFASILLPGLGQAIDGDSRGFIFAGVGLTGFMIATDGNYAENRYLTDNSPPDFNRYRDIQTQQKVGSSMYVNAGFLSAYDTFSSRVKAYQAIGKYQFLPKDQKIEDLLKAPFNFSYMKRATTWIPFLISMGLSLDEYNRYPKPDRFHARGSDALAGPYMSYNAGTGEEAIFRGVIYPTLYEAWDGSWTANAAQALMFGFMHGSRPYVQILAGGYLGYLTEKNGFDMGESIFIHAWWDVWLITSNLIKNRGNANDIYVQLPQVDIRF